MKIVIHVCHTQEQGANHVLINLRVVRFMESWLYLPLLDPKFFLFCIILCFCPEKNDGLKQKSRYRLSPNEHVKRQRDIEMSNFCHQPII